MADGQLGTVLEHIHRLAGLPDAGDLTDRQLLERFATRHEEAAFAALVRRHGPLVLGVCWRVLRHAQDAEDAFQATFLVLPRKAGSIRWQESVSNWLYEVAYRLAKEARSDAARRRAQERQVKAMPQPVAVPETGERELYLVLDEELHRLPERYRTPLVLCYLEGKTRDEAADLLACPLGTLKHRLERGRELLRKRLTRRGLTLSAALLVTGLSQQAAPATVPALLLLSTVKAANVFAASKAAAVGAASARVAELAERILIGMVGTRVKAVTVLVLAAIIAVGGAGALAHRALMAKPLEANQEGQPAEAVSAVDQPNAAVEKQALTDCYGDPLPDRALVRLGTMRFRAPDEVNALALTPDGKTIAVSSRAGLFLFDAGSGKRIKNLASSSSLWGSAHPIVFSPDGKRLAVRGRRADAQSKGLVQVWELADEQKPREYYAEHVTWLGWSAESEPLVVCLEKGGLRLHELASGRSRRFEWKDPRKVELSDYVVCACAPAGRVLAAVEEEGIVHLWDTATGRERYTLRPKNAYARWLALSPDGHTLASLNRDLASPDREVVQLWETTTGKALHTVAADHRDLSTVVFAPDGKTLATAGWRGVRCWDVATGRERSRSQGEGADTERIAFSGDGLTLATVEPHSAAIHLWGVATGKRKPEPAGHRCRPHGTTFSLDGRRLATGGGLDGTIHFWDLATGASLLQIHRPGEWVRDIAFSQDGRSLFSSWTDDNLWVSDAATGERQHVIKLEDPDRPDTRQSAISMHLSDDGKTLSACSYYYPKKNGGRPQYQQTLITGWDTSTRKQLFRRRLPGMGSWIALSADARVLAVPHPESRLEEGTGKGPMRLEELRTGELLLTFPALEGQTWPLAFSPDGRLLASNNSDYKRIKEGDPSSTGASLRLWEVATATEVLSLPIGGQSRAAFSPDGRLLAVTAPLQEILVWDLAQGRELRRFKGFDAEVTWLAFAPDGRRLISGLADSTLLIWDVAPRTTPQTGKLGAQRVAKAWTDLAGIDGQRALQARWTLVSLPEEAVPLLKERLRPVQAAELQRLRRLRADLDSDHFVVRKQANKELEELGELAARALRQSLAERPSLEARQRIETLLDKLRGPVTRPEKLRALRAVAVLEDVATPEARKLLEALAQGAEEARLTQEAKASLERLTRRAVVQP